MSFTPIKARQEPGTWPDCVVNAASLPTIVPTVTAGRIVHSDGGYSTSTEADPDTGSVFATLRTPPRSTTKAATAISTLSEERLNSLLATGARYSESTLRKHSWVSKLYEGFVKAIGREAWPLDGTIAAGTTHTIRHSD